MIFAPPAAIQAGEYVRLPTRAHVVALTFDGGSAADGVPGVLRVLRRQHVPATFFITGRFVRTYPRLARAIGVRYEVGNHTYNHPHLPALSSSQVRREVVRAARVLRAGTGRDPRPLFRFPYGDRDTRTLRIVHSLGYASIRWTVDTLGWMPGQTPSGATARVVGHLVPGEIVLMHLGERVDSRALPGIVRAVRARGYRFVRLTSLSAKP